MNKAYIIIAHKSPEHVYRLIATLDDNLSTFFIHVDKKVSIREFDILTFFGEKVQFVDRVFSNWGSYGLVQATLNAMAAIRNSSIAVDYIILLSGQDYPVKSNTYINDYLRSSPYSVFMEYWPLPNYEKWPEDKGGIYRVNKYFFGLRFHQIFFSKSLNFLGKYFSDLKRKMPTEMEPYAGSQWWIMSTAAMNFALRFVEDNPQYVAFHKNTFGSDELFFQMLFLNAKNESDPGLIKNDNKKLTKWKSTYSSHPEYLSEADLNIIINTDALFARKFDIKFNSNILDLIDEICLKRQLSA